MPSSNTAAEAYAARVDAYNAQRKSRRTAPLPADRWSGPMARRFRADPRRELDANLSVIASFVQPDDVLVDVGGGAGRLCLPLALRCREVIDVDPSPGMRGQFEELVAEAGLKNARYVEADWLKTDGIAGDVVLCANVTYFVREIVPFVERLNAAARRLVLINVGHTPPPAINHRLYKLIHGEEQVRVPGQQELLPVLWELGIVPEVRLLPEKFVNVFDLPHTREEAVRTAMQAADADDNNDDARRVIEKRFDEIYRLEDGIFQPLWRTPSPQVLISWSPTEPRAE